MGVIIFYVGLLLVVAEVTVGVGDEGHVVVDGGITDNVGLVSVDNGVVAS
jgi:hypothetical protein